MSYKLMPSLPHTIMNTQYVMKIMYMHRGLLCFVVVEISMVWCRYNAVLHNTTLNTSVTEVKHGSDLELTIDTPYLALSGEL